MFTGIITHLGKIKDVKLPIFFIEASGDLIDMLDRGTSISVNGVCLTVLEKPVQRVFCVEVMPETFRRTMFSVISSGDLVNLEMPVSINTLFSGHFVQGHVDGVGTVKSVVKDKNSRLIEIELEEGLSRYVVNKGSIAVNGVSLTVIKSIRSSFSVGIIPHTLKHTMLRNIKTGDTVNIETDILAKYIEKVMNKK